MPDDQESQANTNRNTLWERRLFPSLLCVLGVVLAVWWWIEIRPRFPEWMGITTPTPEPPCAPLTGYAIVVSDSDASFAPLFSQPGFKKGAQVAGIAAGTRVEILQSIWMVEPDWGGSYYYFVRSDDRLQFGGWIEERLLTTVAGQLPRPCLR